MFDCIAIFKEELTRRQGIHNPAFYLAYGKSRVVKKGDPIRYKIR